MKKIIYSLVIMIAAGSLFTSCVTNTEPQGIKDLREAKADYIESLKNLKDADAACRKAEVAYLEAKTAWETKQHEIENAIAQAKADATIANKEAKIAEIVAKAKIDAVGYEEELAKAEAQLKRTLDSIAVASNKLSDEEREAVKAYTRVYGKYLEAIEEVHKAEAALYDQNISTEEAHDAVRRDSAATVAQIAYYEELLKNLPDSGESVNQVEEITAKLNAQQLELDYALANCEKEWNLYKTTNLKDNIKGFADGLIDYVAQNAAIPAPFIMNFKTKLPDNEQVCRLMKRYIINSPERFEGPAFLRFVNSVFVEQDAEGDYWLFANAYNAPAARALIWGYDFDGNEVGGVENLIEALNREFVVDSTKWLGIDSTGIKAAVAKAEAEYKAVEEALTDGVWKDADVKAALTVWRNAAPAGKDEAWGHVLDAKKAFYKNYYCKFWGIRYNSLPNFDLDNVCFNNPGRDSLEINFSLKEFTEPTPIVNFDFETMMAENDPFDPSQTAFLPYFEGEFYVPSTRGIFPGYPVDNIENLQEGEAEVFENYQKSIVFDQTKLNQLKLDPDFFGKTLLCQLLYKESVLAYVKSTADTQGTKEALAALQNEVLPSLKAAYYAAEETQSKNSEAFYKFISGLVGEEFLEELCDRIDNACKKAAEFIPAIVIPETKGYGLKYELKSELQRLLDYAQDIASGEQPSKKILISIFEDTMCGEFNSINTRILSLILTLTDEEDTRTTLDKVMAWFSGETEDATMRMFMINTGYTIAYMGLQLGDAFAGDQFRALLSEVVTAYVNTRIDRIKNYYPNSVTGVALGRLVLADYDNVIEMVLFGTERYYELYKALFLDKYTPSTGDMEEMQMRIAGGDIQAQEVEFNSVTDVVFSESRFFNRKFFDVFLRLCGIGSVKYIVSDFSGVLGTLEETYFTEWREKWEEYDLAMAEFAAQQEAIYAAKSVYAQYQNSISSLLNFERWILAQLYGDAVYDDEELVAKKEELAKEVKDKEEAKKKESEKSTSGLYAHLEDVCDFLKKIEAGYDGKTLYFEKVQHELDEALAKLDVITKKLELVTKAYEQVLANHGAEDAE